MNAQTQLLKEESAGLDALSKFAADSALYAVLDAAGAPSVPAKVKELGEDRAVSLYRGGAREDYWSVAPYLVRVDSGVLEWLLTALWEEPWGIFALASEEMEKLRTHFRKFLMVQMPDNRKFYFRFYDPRVLASFLATCSQAELADFFGPVQAFGRGDPSKKSAKFWRK